MLVSHLQIHQHHGHSKCLPVCGCRNLNTHQFLPLPLCQYYLWHWNWRICNSKLIIYCIKNVFYLIKLDIQVGIICYIVLPPARWWSWTLDQDTWRWNGSEGTICHGEERPLWDRGHCFLKLFSNKPSRKCLYTSFNVQHAFHHSPTQT